MNIIKLMVLMLGMMTCTQAELQADDVGVCSKTLSYMTSKRESFVSTRTESYQTCTLAVLFCSTKYRTAYQTTQRTIYRVAYEDVLVCCNGYIESDYACKRKVPASTTPPSTQSNSPTPDHTTSTTPFTETGNTEISTFYNSTLRPSNSQEPFPVMRIRMLSGIAVVPVALILLLALSVFIVLKKRRMRRQPPTPETDEMNQVGYYTIHQVRSEGTEEINAGQAAASVTLPEGNQLHSVREKKKPKLMSVFYSKPKKVKTKEVDEVCCLNGGTAKSSEGEVYYTTDMSSLVNGNVGYIDMTSPVAGKADALPYTDMEGGQEYYAVGSPNDPYDKLDHKRKSDSYDKLDRNDSMKGAESAEPNIYDALDTDEYDDHNGQMKTAYDNQEYDVPGNQLTRVEENVKEREPEVEPPEEKESMYYNTPEENAQMSDPEQDTIYTNIS